MSTPREELDDMFESMRDDGEGDAVVSFDDAEPDVIDTDDGGAIVRLSDEEEQFEPLEFYANLLEQEGPDAIPRSFLDQLAVNIIEAVDLDLQAREPRDKQYEEGLRRTGIGNDPIGGASFNGATKTTHPMITKAAIDFESRAIKEIFPPGGPVKSFIPGEQTKERLEKAERKTRHMNWQLTFQIPEFRPSLEQLLTQLPMGGVQYQRWVYSPRKKRAIPSFVPVDRMIIPYAAENFYTAERRTFIDDITQLEFEQRVADGIYIDENLLAVSSNVPEPTQAEKANQKIEGVTPDPENRDGQRRMYEVEMELDLSEWDQEAGEEDMRPYIVRVDKDNRRVVGIVRNWEQDETTNDPLCWTIEWPFVPWRGSMPIGIAQMIGGLSAAATGAMRALLDSAHINNIPTLLKLKGSGQGGQSVTLEPTQIQELEGTMGADDIRKLVMAVPFNEPSLVLYQLLGFLVQEGESVVRTTFEDLAEQKTDMPVGTTLALIEQGMAVLSAIHGRLYAAMQKTISVLHRINRMYLEDDDVRDQTGELLARHSDYQGPEDVIPVADPRIFSEIQRFAQMQVVADRAEKRPALYNQRKVELLILERLKFPNPEQLLVPAPDPKELNAVNENVAATLGRPVAAFPEQDHLAHIQAHVDYMFSPFFGMLQPIAAKLFPAMVTHLVEHVVLWYASRVYEQASAAANMDFAQLMKYKDPETRRESDRALAAASNLVIKEAAGVMARIPDVIAKATEIVQHFQQAMAASANNPEVAAAATIEKLRGQNQLAIEQARQQGRSQQAQAQAQAQAQESAADRLAQNQAKMRELQLRVVEGTQKHQMQSEKLRAEDARENFRQANENERTDRNNAADIAMNTSDNDTALAIASAEIASNEKVSVSTGTGINPGTK